MALQTSGPIDLLDVIGELDGSASPRAIQLGSSEVRDLAGKPSGIIWMSDLYGASSVVSVTTTLTAMSFTRDLYKPQFGSWGKISSGFGTFNPEVIGGHTFDRFVYANEITYERIELRFTTATPANTITVTYGASSITLNADGAKKMYTSSTTVPSAMATAFQTEGSSFTVTFNT